MATWQRAAARHAPRQRVVAKRGLMDEQGRPEVKSSALGLTVHPDHLFRGVEPRLGKTT